jgi:hypothetical protein
MDENQKTGEQSSISQTIPSQEVVPQKSGGSKKIIICCLLGVIAICIIGIIGIQIYRNSLSNTTKTQKKIATATVTTLPIQKSVTTAPTIEPHLIVNKQTLDLKSATVATDDGNIYLVSGEKKELLIDSQANKNYFHDYPVNMDFVQAELSPDKSKLFACAYANISRPVLFYVNLNDINNSQQADTCTDAAWSPNSRYIAFTNATGDCGPANSNLGFYDTKVNKTYYLATFNHLPTISNLSFKTILYNSIQWLPDSSGVSAHYTAYSEDEGCMMGMETKPVNDGTITFPLSQKFSVNF